MVSNWAQIKNLKLINEKLNVWEVAAAIKEYAHRPINCTHLNLTDMF